MNLIGIIGHKMLKNVNVGLVSVFFLQQSYAENVLQLEGEQRVVQCHTYC